VPEQIYKPGVTFGLFGMRSVKRQKMCSLGNLKKPRSATTLYEPIAVSFCHPEPDFLPRCAGHGCVCAFPCKERHMKFANATNLNRKSGGAKPRDLRFCVSRRGPQNCRSLGFARDDKKERATVHKEWLLNRGIWTFSSTKERSCLSTIFRVSRIGPQNRRSLGFARDDKRKGQRFIKSGY
jgi:hypothetical protein